MRQFIPTPRRAPMLVTLVTITCMGVIILPQVQARRELHPKDADFEQALADSLWTMISSIDDSSITDDTIQDRFDRAFQLVPRHELGRLYVFLGDSDSGQVAFRRVVGGRVAQIAEEGKVTVEKLFSPENLPEPTARIRSRVEQSLSKLPAAIARSEKDEREAFIRYARGQSDFSEQCYLAAVAECPDYLPAWTKLALRTEEPLKGLALREWIARDPDNSLPCYFLAAALAEDDPDEAIRWLEHGNRRPRCLLPLAELPQFTELRFPDSKAFRELELAGTPVSPVGFTNACHVINLSYTQWQHPSSHLRSMVRTLQAKALADCCSMHRPHCKRLLDELFQTNVRLVTSAHGDMALFFLGMAGLSIVEDLLRQDDDSFFRQKGQRLWALRRVLIRPKTDRWITKTTRSSSKERFSGRTDLILQIDEFQQAVRKAQIGEQLTAEFRRLKPID